MTDNPYWIFKNSELAKSKVLAKELNISEADFNNIQYWFDLLFTLDIADDQCCSKRIKYKRKKKP